MTVAELAITTIEAEHVFERIVTLAALPQVVVSSGELRARLEQWIEREPLGGTGLAGADPAVVLYPRPQIGSGYVAPTNEIERRLATIWQQLFGIDQIGIHDNFFELGGDSLLATQLASRLRDAFQVELPLRSLFEIATVAGLALVIAETLLEQIDPDVVAEIAGLTQSAAQTILTGEQPWSGEEDDHE